MWYKEEKDYRYTMSAYVEADSLEEAKQKFEDLGYVDFEKDNGGEDYWQRERIFEGEDRYCLDNEVEWSDWSGTHSNTEAAKEAEQEAETLGPKKNVAKEERAKAAAEAERYRAEADRAAAERAKAAAEKSRIALEKKTRIASDREETLYDKLQAKERKEAICFKIFLGIVIGVSILGGMLPSFRGCTGSDAEIADAEIAIYDSNSQTITINKDALEEVLDKDVVSRFVGAMVEIGAGCDTIHEWIDLDFKGWEVKTNEKALYIELDSAYNSFVSKNLRASNVSFENASVGYTEGEDDTILFLKRKANSKAEPCITLTIK